MQRKIKITEITSEHILFSDGSEITCNHYPECCEYNYADFEQLDDIARETEFALPLEFERLEGYGFRFGHYPQMFFVPCYSEQSGYYSSDVDILYRGDYVLTVESEII